MNIMSKERVQQIWDYELINAWDEKGYNKMWMVIKNFIFKVYPEKQDNYNKVGVTNIIDLLSSLGLRRCLDVNHVTGIDGTYCFNSDVIGFIHGRCEKMSMDLINDVPKPVVLLGVNDYKWVKRDLKGNSKNARQKRIEKIRLQANLKIKARSLSKKHDWGTVK